MKSIIALVVFGFSVLQSPNADAVRDRLDAYLLGYEPQLSALVADEEMTQRTSAQNRRFTVATNRRIHSEVAFIALPGDAGWLGFRRVVKVNGKTVKDRGVPLGQLMAEGARDDYDQARLLLGDSAAHNLGAPRTINLPNLPLELLHPRNRHRFAQGFKDAAALGILVPAEMEETFFVGRSSQGTGTAKYTNYRKFQTSARIVPPPP